VSLKKDIVKDYDIFFTCVQLWNVASGSCFVTFTEHANSITAVLFLPANHVVVSASLDGTVRAFDLVRYRNFRTFTTPTPTQFVSLAADSSGEILCAGTLDGFQVLHLFVIVLFPALVRHEFGRTVQCGHFFP